jgi:eukaryotic-like serine/threonine-protein kinase
LEVLNGPAEKSSEQPGDRDGHRREAERLLVDWCIRQAKGAAESLDELVGAHAELAADLRELHARMDGLDSLVGAADPGELLRALDVPAPDASADGPMEALLKQLAGGQAPARRYVAGQQIERGGMGTILKVRDRTLRRDVALKLLTGDGADGPDVARARFLAEAYVTGRLDHPGIVPVHDLGLDDSGRLFFTMKLVDGITFREVLERVARGEEGWTVNRAVGVLSRVAEAVAYAHSKGVLHRDIKPANIMVGRFGETFLMDWGLARVMASAEGLAEAGPPDELALLSAADLHALVGAPAPQDEAAPDTWLFTQDGKILGTPVYMSPEQARGEIDRVDERSDIWSMGAILYHLLTGDLPWVPPGEHPLPLAVLLRVRNERLPPVRERAPDAPPTLLAICERALAERPDERYRSADEMAAALRDYLEDISDAREEARRQAARAGSLLEFLLGVLASGDPAQARGRDVSVREVLDRAAERVRQSPPRSPLDEAHLRTMLGRLYKELGRFDDAAAQLEPAVARFEEVLGAHHPDTLTAATDLALLYRRLGRADDAENLLRNTLESQTAALGELHPDTLRSQDLLAALLHRTRGRPADAEELYRRAWQGRRVALGERHPDTLSTQSALATVLAELGRGVEAVHLMEDAAAGLVESHGEDHPGALVALSDLARLYAQLERLGEAEAIYRRTLPAQERVVGPEHPDALTTRNNLGMVLLRQGRPQEALEQLQRAADVHTRALGIDHPRTLGFRANLGLALLEAGRAAEAEALLGDVIARAGTSPGADPAHVARYQSNHARSLAALDRGAEAEAEFKLARGALAGRLAADHAWLREIDAELAALRRPRAGESR